MQIAVYGYIAAAIQSTLCKLQYMDILQLQFSQHYANRSIWIYCSRDSVYTMQIAVYGYIILLEIIYHVYKLMNTWY